MTDAKAVRQTLRERAGGPEENDTKFCQYCGGAIDAACTPDADLIANPCEETTL